jgi:hypothetical protein
MPVCSIHCKKPELLALKTCEIERIFLHSILHAIVIVALAADPAR